MKHKHNYLAYHYLKCTRLEAMLCADRCADDILDNLIKILLYSNDDDETIRYHAHRIAMCLRYVDRIRIGIGPFSRHLSKSDLQLTLFGFMGDEPEDYMLSLAYFQCENKRGKFIYHDNTTYPEIEPDEKSADDLMAICYDVMETTLPLLRDHTNHSAREYCDILIDIVKKYL